MHGTEEEKMMALFMAVHKLPVDYHIEIGYNEGHDIECVNVLYNEKLCWQATKVDLLFDFITTKLKLDNVLM